MGARHKLNAAYVCGCLIVSSLFGIAAESWIVFLGVLVAAIAGCYTAGDIRTQPTRRLSKTGPEIKVARPSGRHRRR